LTQEREANVEELTSRLVVGDETALAQAYDLYGGAVYRLALRITQDQGIAEEVCLDAFLQLWQQAPTLEQRGGNLLGWLFTIARSRAIDRVRLSAAMKRTPVDAAATITGVQPEDGADLAQRRDIVRQAMSALSQQQRAALELAYYEGLSHSQIAQRLGEPLGTVKTHIRQAMILMRRSLAPIISGTS
jgi:RNA polymerase sigma-70 factor (ECF subfamily)